MWDEIHFSGHDQYCIVSLADICRGAFFEFDNITIITASFDLKQEASQLRMFINSSIYKST
jgi:hypothetical protein